MPTYVLRPGDVCAVPNEPLSLAFDGGAAAVATMVTPVRADGPVGAPEVIRHPRGAAAVLTLNKPTAPLTLRFSPTVAEHFPSGMSLNLSLFSPSASSDPVRVSVGDVDPSGLPFLDAVDVVPMPDGSLQLQVLGKKPVAVADDDHTNPGLPVAGLAKLAVDATREALGQAVLKADDMVDLRIVVDASASMLPWTDNGSLAAALAILGGVDNVIGRDSELDVRLSTDRQDAWEKIHPNQVGEKIAARLQSTTRTSGFHAPAALAHGPWAQVVLTDLVPSDWNPGPKDCCLLLCRSTGVDVLASGDHVVALDTDDVIDEVWADSQRLSRVVRGILAVALDPKYGGNS